MWAANKLLSGREIYGYCVVACGVVPYTQMVGIRPMRRYAACRAHAGRGRPDPNRPPLGGAERKRSMRQKTESAGQVTRAYTAEEAGRPDAVEAVGRAIVTAAAPAADRKTADAWRASMLAAAAKPPKWAASWGLINLAAGVGVDPVPPPG